MEEKNLLFRQILYWPLDEVAQRTLPTSPSGSFLSDMGPKRQYDPLMVIVREKNLLVAG
jgi:hypothetical protein